MPAPPPRTAASEPSPAGSPFAGLRVVDLSTFWSGAYVGCYLGAFGADVIKVESVQKPDGFRFVGAFPFDGDDWFEHGPLFQGANLNKRAITLDLGSVEGREALRQLISSADVLIENFSPRVLEQFQLTEKELLALKPELIVMRMPGFGLEGPWRNFVGWAYGFEQTGGMSWVTGHADGPPINPGGVADPIVGVHAAIALLGALEHRARTGVGQLVEVAQIEVAAAISAEQVLAFSMSGELQTRWGNRQRDMIQGVYPARADGDVEDWVAISVRGDGDWDALTDLLGSPAALGAEDFSSHEGRWRQHDEIDEHIAGWTRSLPPGDIISRLRERGVPAAVVLVPAAMYADPQLLARDYYCEFVHPVSGARRYPGWPMRYEPGPAQHHRSGAPTLGQHNDEVLGEDLGFTEAQLADLRARNVIGSWPLGL